MTIIILLSLVVFRESRIQEGLHWVVLPLGSLKQLKSFQGQQLEEQIFAELGWPGISLHVQKASPCGLSAWVSLCFLTEWWSQGWQNFLQVHGFNAGPSKPGRLCITFYDLPWEVAYHFCHSFLVNWSLRFGLDSKRGATEFHLWEVNSLFRRSKKLQKCISGCHYLCRRHFLVYTIDAPVRDTISLFLWLLHDFALHFPFF